MKIDKNKYNKNHLRFKPTPIFTPEKLVQKLASSMECSCCSPTNRKTQPEVPNSMSKTLQPLENGQSR